MLLETSHSYRELDDFATVCANRLESHLRQDKSLDTLVKATKLAKSLVTKTRDVGYMLNSHAFNDAVEAAFEAVTSDILPPSTCMGKRQKGDVRRICIFASELYNTGGHTRIIEDILATQAEHFEITMLLTGTTKPRGPFSVPYVRWRQAKVYRADSRSLKANIRSVHTILEEIDPDVVINMSHPFDVIAHGFMMRETQRKWLYGVHADYSFSFLPPQDVAELLVFTEPCGSNFEAKGIPHIKLPLTCLQEEPIQNAPYSSPTCEGLLTMSVGTAHKFFTQDGMSYSDVLVARFKAAEGTHIHVGFVTDDFRKEIETALVSHGFAERVKFLGTVPNVNQSIIDLQVDLFINSYPIGGGKVIIEAMATGCPISQCDDGRSTITGEPMVYPEALRWRDMDELEQSIRNIDEGALLEQRQFSHAHYLKTYSSAAFENTLGAILRE